MGGQICSLWVLKKLLPKKRTGSGFNALSPLCSIQRVAHYVWDSAYYSDFMLSRYSHAFYAGTTLEPAAYRVLGASIGSGVFFNGFHANSTFVNDHELVTIGDGSVINYFGEVY